MCTSNQHNNWKFVALLFCHFEIFSMFLRKLLRFPGSSLFLSSFWNVWLFLNFISPFISLEKTVSSYFYTKWMHLIYIIRNVFQQRKFHTNSSNLQFGISLHVLVMSFTGMFLQTQLHWGHPWKTKKTEDTDVGTTVELDEHHQVDSAAHSGHSWSCMAFVRGV